MRKSQEAPRVKEATWAGEMPTLIIGRFHTRDGWGYYDEREGNDAPKALVMVDGKEVQGTVLGCGKTGDESLCRVMVELDGGITEVVLPCVIQGNAVMETPRAAPQAYAKPVPALDQVELVLQQIQARRRAAAPTILPVVPDNRETVLQIRKVEPTPVAPSTLRGCAGHAAILIAAGVAIAVAACTRTVSTPDKPAAARQYPMGKWHAEGIDHKQLESMLQIRGVQWWTDKDEEGLIRENFQFGRSRGLKESRISGDDLQIVASYNRDTRMLHLRIGDEWEVMVSETGDTTVVTELAQK